MTFLYGEKGRGRRRRPPLPEDWLSCPAHGCGNYHLIDKMILIISASVGDDPPLDWEFDVFWGPPLSARTDVGWKTRPMARMIVRVSSIDLSFFISSSLKSQDF